MVTALMLQRTGERPVLILTHETEAVIRRRSISKQANKRFIRRGPSEHLPCPGTLSVPGFAWRCFLGRESLAEGPRG